MTERGGGPVTDPARRKLLYAAAMLGGAGALGGIVPKRGLASSHAVTTGAYSAMVLYDRGTVRAVDSQGVTVDEGENAALVLKAALDTRGLVAVTPGPYNLDAMLDVPGDTHLAMHPGAVLRPLANIDLLRLRPGAIVSGGKINAAALPGYTRSAVILDGEDRFGLNHRTEISSMQLLGSPGEGRGLDLRAGDSAGDNVVYCRFEGLTIRNFAEAIRLEATVPPSGNAFVNGNVFNDIGFENPRTAVHIAGSNSTPNAANGNFFHNLQVQVGASTIAPLIFCEGARNAFTNLQVWDWPGSASGYPVTFAEGSEYNVVQVFGLDERHLDDGGQRNVFASLGPSRPKYAPLLAAAPSNLEDPQFAGEQHDFLAFADRRFSVTQTRGPAPKEGSLPEIFDLGMRNGPVWEPLSGEVVELVIDFGAPVHFWSHVGVNFIFGRAARSVQVDLHDATSPGTWDRVLDLNANRSASVVAKVTANAAAIMARDRLRVTLAGTQPGQSEIRVQKLWAFTKHETGASWLPAANGTLFGGLDLNDQPLAGALRHTGPALGFFGVPPVAQRADVGEVDASNVSDTYGSAEAAVLADVADKVNELRAALRALGLLS